MYRPEFTEKINSLPLSPGVYIYKDDNNDVIYVGKARRLRDRVKQYFMLKLDETSKTYALVNKIESIDYIEVASEFDALILEAELIKKYRPKYNIVLKDDKSYIYLVIRNEVVGIGESRVNLPAVLTARRTTLKDKDIVFGPYPDGTTVKSILKTVRKIFGYRDCSLAKFKKYEKLKSPCLFGHLNLCSAPCVNNSTDGLALYKKNISLIRRLLSGEGSSLVTDLDKEMKAASKEHNYERAASIRDLLFKFNYVRQNYRTPSQYIDNPYLLDDLKNTSLDALKEALPNLKSLPRRIECYDISNISGKEAVASMVVATDGNIDKASYRKFKIKLKSTPDDFDMMREVLYRRLKHEIKHEPTWPTPDLIVVDGGKGQVSAALEIMNEYNLSIPIAGIAKKFETLVYVNSSGVFNEVLLDKSNAGLSLIIRLRDEAHRFAQSYHHLLRLKSIRV